MRLEPEIKQLGMFCIVIMRLRFHARIGEMIDFHFETHLPSYRLDVPRQVENRELLSELIVDAEFTRLGGVQASQLYAADRIANVEESTGLTTFSIHREWIANRCLGAEAV